MEFLERTDWIGDRQCVQYLEAKKLFNFTPDGTYEPHFQIHPSNLEHLARNCLQEFLESTQQPQETAFGHGPTPQGNTEEQKKEE